MIFEKLKNYSSMIKISHTLFALPFAAFSAILAILNSKLTKEEIIYKFILILICMFSARSAAMGFNRYIDAEFDEKNPRTKIREIPSKLIDKKSVFYFILFFSVLFIFTTYFISIQCFYYSFPTLFLILFYSYTKRLTYLCHFFLGFSIGLAPLAAWVAILDRIDFLPLLWTFGLMFHIAGFDILYSCADAEFDKSNGLYSIPSRFGIKNAFFIARVSHVLSFAILVYAGIYSNLGYAYFIFLSIIGILFLIEHFLVKENDLSKLPIAFFHINASISIVLFIGILIDKWKAIFEKIQ